MNILFSPIGFTDPISNFRDGSLLHICRYYDINKIYLYMSKEIYARHIKDNRYIYSLDRLGERLGKKFEYEFIIKEDLVDVHIFDVFINEFTAKLNEIHKNYPDAKIYLNISSGTPVFTPYPYLKTLYLSTFQCHRQVENIGLPVFFMLSDIK